MSESMPEVQGLQSLFISIQDDGVAIITIDVPEQKMNTLTASFAKEAEGLIDELVINEDVKAIVITSGKSDSFVAGADINMLNAVTTAKEARELSEVAQSVMNKIAACPKPIVAAINGLALGGGYELALACRARIASDNPKTAVGLPEVMLGILPGSGGTQRLLKLVGISKSLDLMMTGRQVKGFKAQKMGLLDEIVPNSILLDVAAQKALSLVGKSHAKKKEKFNIQTLLLEKNPLGRKVLFDQARKQLLKKTKGNYPAPERILDVVKKGISSGFEAGLKLEAQFFGELVVSPESNQLMKIYFAQNELKKETFVSDPSIEIRTINELGILGGGLMGGGIGVVSLDRAGCNVRVKDINDDGIRQAIRHVHEFYAKKVKRRSISKQDAACLTQKFTGSLDFSGFEKTDLMIEAVFEDLSIKHKVLQDIERCGNPDTIFASNTSSLRVRDIAQAAKKPENVIGMHYFSPVEKMPLLEIIVHEKTADWVTASCVAFGKRQGKTVIVVKDGAGFYVNRILVPYMNEAAYLAMEGVPLDVIDKAIVQWGMPVGPFKLLDEVGIDIANHMLPNLESEFGVRMSGPGFLEKLINDGRKGKKTEKGFYDYSSKAKGKTIDKSVYELLGVTPNKKMSASDIVDRCILPLVNEAVMCLEDKTIACKRDGDIGAVFGIGFPPFRGGPFRYIETVGQVEVVEKLKGFEKELGERFKAAESLI